MSTTGLRSTLPAGKFALSLASTFHDTASDSESTKGVGELVALRYQFKPASINLSTPGTLNIDTTGRLLHFAMPSGANQVFDSREEACKPRECVLLMDREKKSFTLHPLPSTLHLTLNRSLSVAHSAPSHSNVSSSSVRRLQPLEPENAKRSKRARQHSPQSDAVETQRRTLSGKGLARKSLPVVSSAHVSPQKTMESKGPPAKGRARRDTSKVATAVQASKIKSVEIIEDSDEEDEDDMEDEFAKMVGEAVAGVGYEDDDDEEDDVEEDDEDDELGGASYRRTEDPDVEWI